jgi:hypothetical protein
MITINNITPEEYDTYVGLLTLEQKNDLVGQLYMPDSFFFPIQDVNGNWIISTQEIDQCVNPVFMWVKDLPLIIYEPIPDLEFF